MSSVELVCNDSLGNIASQAAEVGIAVVGFRPKERWLAENQNSLDSSNTYVEQRGLPLASYRRF